MSGARVMGSRSRWAALTAVALVWTLVGSPDRVVAEVAGAHPGTPRGAAAVLDVASHHTCVILSGGGVKCWGFNLTGQLGLGDTNIRGDGPNEMGANLPLVDLGPGRSATAVATGDGHTCALLDDATVKCWGEADFGPLGLGDAVDRGFGPNQMGANLPAVDLGLGRTAVALSASLSHTCALLDNASVKCWGQGFSLGLGDTQNRGDQPGQMGANLPTVDLGPGRSATAIATAPGHNCALLDNGSVKCWGANAPSGQLGLGDINARGDQPGEMGANLPAVDLGPGRTAVGITTGGNHTCALLDNGAVKCWGQNFRGQLGLGDQKDRGNLPNQMGANLPTVDLGPGRTATAISAGGDNTCAVLDNGAIKCWGANGFGQLGLGDISDRGDEANEMGANLRAVDLGLGHTALTVSVSFYSTCALLDDATVKCWGFGDSGRLGSGNNGSRGAVPGSMGANLPVVDLAGFVVPAADHCVAPAASPASGFVALSPVRVFDTRVGEAQGAVFVSKQRYGAGSILRVKMTCAGGVPPSGVEAVSLNVTVANPAAAGFVTVYPCGDRPLASNLNYVAGQVVPNAVIAPLSASGEVCFFSQVDTDVLADVNGWFATGSGFGALSPVRVFDTRIGEAQGAVAVTKQRYGGGNILRVKVTGAGGVPASSDVGAVSLNVTVANSSEAGFVTVFPCGDRPLASSLNYVAGQVVPNAVIAPVSASGEVCFFASADTDLLADVNGWFATGLGFAALSPVRVFDTRAGEAQGAVAVTKQQYGGVNVLSVKVAGIGGVPASGVAAVSLNVTVANPTAAGFVTVYPCGDRPLASSLNYIAGQVVPNAVIAPVSAAGEVCLFSSANTDLLADVNGWFAV